MMVVLPTPPLPLIAIFIATSPHFCSNPMPFRPWRDNDLERADSCLSR
jgi:hypothetical protein